MLDALDHAARVEVRTLGHRSARPRHVHRVERRGRGPLQHLRPPRHVVDRLSRPARRADASRRSGRRSRPASPARATGSRRMPARCWRSAARRSRARRPSGSPARSSGIAGHPSGSGYWLFASDGSVYAFGDAGVLRRSCTASGSRRRSSAWRRRRSVWATGWSGVTAGCSASATPGSSVRPAPCG